MTDGRSNVRLCAELGVEWKDRVEQLLFFNPQQAQLEERILETIHTFGLPRVVLHDRVLRVEVGESQPVGTLFALVARDGMEELAGLLLFLRREHELLCVHLSVAESYTAHGPDATLRVAAHLLDGLCQIGRRIAGVDCIAMYYKRNGWYTLPLSAKLL